MAQFRSIPLTKGMTTIVDVDDYDAISAIGRWCYSNSGYAVHYYQDEQGRRKTLYLHRVIYQRILRHPIPPNFQVDHCNRNRIDNRRRNLRLATRSQNQAHKGLQVNNTSQYKGISFNRGCYEARIRHQGKRLHLGRYADGQEAALMYDAASRLLNREFAGCNFPQQPTPPHIEQQLKKLLNKRGIEISPLVSKPR